MKIVGLIAEYNPFHSGHKYHIEKAREITAADAIIVVMSGNFVQRGTPAIMPKHLRAEAALKAGASLVIELPITLVTASVLAPFSFESFRAAIVSAVSPDWLTSINKVFSSTSANSLISIYWLLDKKITLDAF